MLTSKQCLDKFGQPGGPTEGNYMILWDVPTSLEIGVIPKKVYCNKLMVAPLTVAFQNLIARGFVNELKTWDGCYQVRKKKGATSLSLHSWGCAVDMNQAWNQFGSHNISLTPGFVKCFTDAGLEWGGTWTKPDGMHFQLATV